MSHLARCALGPAAAAALVLAVLPGPARVCRAASGAALRYEVSALDPAHHTIGVALRIRHAPAPLEVAMPLWSPGAYRAVGYGRFVQPVEALGEGGRELAWTTGPAGTWRIDGARAGEEVVLRYRVTADRLTEEGDHADGEHAYLNGPATFLCVPALRQVPATVRFVAPRGWRIASALEGGPELFFASDYDALVDAPTEMGSFDEARVTVAGVPFRVVVHGAGEGAAKAVARALARVAEAERRLVGFFPFKRYLLLVHAIEDRRILGIEHASSASLLLTRSLLAGRDAGEQVSWVLAHELYHAWNAKLLRPAELARYDYLHEQPTRLLWFTEGVTEYYAYRALRVAGLLDDSGYLAVLAGELVRVRGAPPLPSSIEDEGAAIWRRADTSTEAESTFYSRAHVLAALLDLELRARTGGRRSLDELMRELLGAARAAEAARALDRPRLRAALERRGGTELAALFDRWTTGAAIPDPTAALAAVGLVLDLRPGRFHSDAGFETERRDDGLRVAGVRPGGPAQRAGLVAGDRLLTVAGVVADESWEARVLSAPGGTRVSVVIAGPEGPVEHAVVLDEHYEHAASLRSGGDETATALRRAWLDGRDAAGARD